MNFKDEALLQIRASALNRIRPADERVGGHYRQAVVGIAECGEILMGVKGKHSQDVNLSPNGRAAKVAEFVQKDALQRFATVTKDVRKALRHSDAKLKSFGPAKPDPTDLAGALQRQEIRSYVRSLPQGERYQMAGSTEFAAAILDGPPVLSGLDPHFYEQLREAHVQALHGPEIQKVEEFRQTVEEANVIAVYVRNMLQEASGMTREGFEAALLPLEAAADAD